MGFEGFRDVTNAKTYTPRPSHNSHTDPSSPDKTLSHICRTGHAPKQVPDEQMVPNERAGAAAGDAVRQYHYECLRFRVT